MGRALGALLLAFAGVASAAPELSIVPQDYDIVLVAPVRGNPNAVDVWSRAAIINTGERARGVTAHLVSSSNSYLILDGNLHFGTVRPTTRSRVVFSRDTFRLRITVPSGHKPGNLLEIIRTVYRSLEWQIGCRNCSRNQPPSANAGPDQTVFTSQLVTLDGSKSTDPQGLALSYKWSFVSVPTGSAATLSGATSVNPTFTPDRVGDYIVQLIVNDGSLSSAPDAAQISTINSPPIANAGPDQTAFVGQLVQLDGSGSTDIDGDALTYMWSIVSAPEGSTATIQNPDSVKPTFRPDIHGDYLIQLQVDDGTATSAPDTMLLSTLNSKPVANAGPDQTVHVNDTAVLDGSASSDADQDPLTFLWSLTTRPSGSVAVLTGATTVKPSFKVDKPGMYVAQLVVNDGTSDSDPDTVAISTINSRPVAVAGGNQTVHWGATILLDGAGSSDPDGDPLSFTWAILSQPDGSAAQLSDVHVIAPTFIASAVGIYVVQLIVDDGMLMSAPSTLTITSTNQAPVAHNDAAVTTAGTPITIDVLANDSDPDGDPVHVASVTQPPSGSVSIAAPAVVYTPKAGFSGVDSFTYVVSDGIATATATVTVTVSAPLNHPPVANAGPPPTGYLGDSLQLDGSASFDPDGTPVTYSWSIISGPAGGASLDATSVVGPHISATIAGTYVVQLVVSDGILTSAPATTSAVFRSLPTISIADVQIPEGNSGLSPMTFAVTLSAPINRAVSVSYATHDGTATAPSDYIAASGTLMVPANATAASITVQVIGDTIPEPDETFTLVLSTPTNATLATATATGTILNDDIAPPPSLLQLTVTNGGLSVGDVSTAQIILPTPLPTTDTTVSLLSSAPSIASVPMQVLIPAGQAMGFVSVQALQPGSATLTASTTGLQPAAVGIQVADREFSVALLSTSMNAGAQVTATVTLNVPAPASGASLNVVSSDPNTLTVSPASLAIAAGGLQGTITLTALTAGTADISVSAATGTVGSQVLHINIEAAAADNTQTSDALIAAALAAGQLSNEQALIYRVYAAYGWPQLPAQYRGRVDVLFDSSLRTDINQQWPTLSPATQTALVPFLMPPIYAGSWGDPAVIASATAASQAKLSPAMTSAKPAAVNPAASTPTDPNPCSSILAPLPGIVPGWAHIDTVNFRVWYRTVAIGNPDFTLADSAAAAGNTAAIAEEVYASEVAVMGRAPLRDTNVACNGGDSRIDVYMNGAHGGMIAETVPYPGACTQTPAYIWMTPAKAYDAKTARDLFAHEFMHMIQFTYGRAFDCTEYNWLDEGTANWAIEHVYHDDNYEHVFSNLYFTDIQLSVQQFATPLDLEGRGPCGGGYCTYTLFEYITKTYGDNLIHQIDESTALFDSIGSVDAGLGSGLSLRDVWHDFSIDAYNDWKAHVEDDFFRWDSDPAGFRSLVFDANQDGTVVQATLNGGNQADLTEDLDRAFVSARGAPGFSPIYRLTSRAVDIKFADPAASFIQLVNPAAGAGIPGAPPGLGGIDNPDLKIWAIMHVNGAWQSPVDFTNTTVLTFCRDQKDQQIDELVLIYSNGNITSRGSDTSSTDWYIDLDPGNDVKNSFAPHLYLSNIGCFQWKGTSKITTTDTKGGVQTASASVTFEFDPNFPIAPGQYWAKFFQPKEGTLTLQGTGIDQGGSCTEDIQQISVPLSTTPTIDDGYFYIYYSPPPPIMADLLRHAFDGGRVSQDTTIHNVNFTMNCPPNPPFSFVGDYSADWLQFDLNPPPVGALVSSDGQLLAGSVTAIDPVTGVKTVSEWILQAQKEN